MDNIRGIALMTGGMAAFALGDLMVKLASQTVPLPQLVLVQSMGGLVIFLLLVAFRGERLANPVFFTRPVLVRNAGEIIAVVGINTGIALSALSSVSALMQVLPLTVMLGAVAFLGERVGWRRWVSVAVGFVGVLIVLRPAGGVEPGLLWVLFGVIGLTMRDVSTRAVDQSAPSIVLAVYSFGVIVPVAAVWLLIDGSATTLDARSTLLLAGMIVSVSTAFFLVTSSLRKGEVSAVAPFRYTRLLFALVLAMGVLGERPDAWVLGGSALIIASGLYALLRERERAAA